LFSLAASSSAIGATPVEAHVSFRAASGALEEVVHLLDAAGERKSLLDEQRLADIIDGHGGEGFVDFALVWIEVDADEIERTAGLGRVEDRLCGGPDEGPRDNADGDEMFAVFGANSRGHLVHPGRGDLDRRPFTSVEGESLHKALPSEFAADPPLLRVAADHGSFIRS
jgi:hypothetical protein